MQVSFFARSLCVHTGGAQHVRECDRWHTSERSQEICHSRYDPGMSELRNVDPTELRVPPSRRQGADPAKLARQISLFGNSTIGMPPPWIYEGVDGVLILFNGVTRATRIAKLNPGQMIQVEVIGKLARAFANESKIGDLLP